MKNHSICRIGIFYDGYYFIRGRRNLCGDTIWLHFTQFHSYIQDCVQARQQDYTHHHIVYAAWFQGMFASTQSEDWRLRKDRDLHHDLMHAGIEPKFLPMPQAGTNEKGVDVALAVDAIQLAVDGKIDIAVLVTGDTDFVPLVRALMKQGVRVMTAYFEYNDGQHRDWGSDRLLHACNFALRINDIAKHEAQEVPSTASPVEVIHRSPC